MDGAWFARVRWRRRGAWLWPAFAALTVADGIIGHALPPTGETQTFVAAVLLGCGFNLIAVILLRRPLGALVRRARPDLPKLIARDYAGTAVVGVVSAALLVLLEQRGGCARRLVPLVHLGPDFVERLEAAEYVLFGNAASGRSRADPSG